MSPRILDTRRCPHCKAELPDPTPRMCPSCGGSLQQRHLKMGCLTTAPKIVLVASAAWALGDYVLHVLRG
jgi:predicted amidophosphoribosyltransferase